MIRRNISGLFALALSTATALAANYVGTVTYNGYAVPSASIIWGGAIMATTTGGGAYSIPASSGAGTTQLSASKSGYVFTPVHTVPIQLAADTTYNFTVSSGPLPTLNVIADLATFRDTPSTVNLTGIARGDDALPMTLTVTAVSANAAVVPNPSVTYTSPGSTATLNLNPVAGATGSSLITVTVRRQDNVTVVRTFTCTVNPITTGPSAGPATSLEFDGTAARYVNLQNFPVANSSFSIELWARRRITNNWSVLVAQGVGSPSQRLHIGFRPQGVFTFGFYANDLDTTTAYLDTNWHHWACTFDANTKARRIYRDGVQVAADTSTNNFLGSGVMTLGWVGWQGTPFNGEMADVRIWKVARTAQEVAANRHASIVPTTIGLLANYRFNEGLGQSVADIATSTANPDQGGVQNGSLVNDPIFLGADSVLGRAAYFPANETVTITNFGALLPTQNVTVEFWQKTELLAQASAFRLVPDINSNRFNLHLGWTDGQIYWDFGDIATASGFGRVSYLPPVSITNTWNHFAFVSSGGNNQKIYRNGVLEREEADGSSFVPGPGRDLVIAPRGTMADFRIWSVARTGAQIAGNRFTPVPTNSTGLILNLRFNETSASTPLADAAIGNGAQPGGASSGVQFIRSSFETLSALLTVPVIEDAPQLVYLPAADRDSAFTFSSVNSSNGTLTQITNGIFQYTPTGNYSGADTVTYITTDGTRGSTGRVDVQISAVNDAPFAGPGSSLNLNMVGNGQYVDLPDGVWFGDTFTIEGWVYLRSYESYGALAGFGNGTSANNVLGLTSSGADGRPTFWIYRDSAEQHLDSSQVIPLKTWTHLAFTRDGSGIGHIYMNGSQIGVGPIHAPMNVSRTNNFIGTDIWGEAMNGNVAEVRIWDVARTGQELANNFHVALPGDTSGLVAHYRLNEGSGVTAIDSGVSGGAQNGTIVNSPPWMTTDGPLASIALNGTTQDAQTFSSAALAITGAITLEAWIRPAVAGQMGIIEKFDVADGGYMLRREVDGRIRFSILDSETTNSFLISRTAAPENVWTHVAGVWDGLQNKIYINGVLDASELSGRAPKAGTTKLHIGSAGPLAAPYKFNGRISDVRIWNVARNAGEISSSLGGVGTNAAGLVVFYRPTASTVNLLPNLAAASGVAGAALNDGVIGVAEQGLLAMSEVVRYVEDTSLQLILPAFDVESVNLVYSNVSASTGALTLISGNRYTFAPPTNYNGSATISYTVSDGTNSANAILQLQGIAVEDPPTLTAIGARSLGEGAADTISIFLSDGDPELLQNLVITATSSDTTLIRNPKVTAYNPSTGVAELTIKGRPGKSGTATITVTVTDPATGGTAVQSFVVTVNAFNDPPNIGPATALEFNGSNYVRVAGFGTNAPRDEITIEFWQRVTNAAPQSTFVMNPDNSANRINAHVPYADGKVYWDFGAPSGRLAYVPPVSIIGSWQHFAFVASQSGNYMKIFRNGIEEATKPGMVSFVRTNIDLNIGRFAGQLAEFRIWNVARTAPEIQAAMHGSLPNGTTNLIVYYRFNQKPLLTLTDFASTTDQGGSQDGELIPETNPALVGDSDNDPAWRTQTGQPSYQVSDPALQLLQIVRIPDGATTNLFLPAWDAENGLTLTWQNIHASTGSVKPHQQHWAAAV